MERSTLMERSTFMVDRNFECISGNAAGKPKDGASEASRDAEAERLKAKYPDFQPRPRQGCPPRLPLKSKALHGRP